MASNSTTSRASTVSRLFWMLIGPSILSALGMVLALKHAGWFAPRSMVYVGVLIAVLVARWLDPLDSSGRPSTSRQLQSELAFLLVLGVGGWIVANWWGTPQAS